jgi:hypothetical protein
MKYLPRLKIKININGQICIDSIENVPWYFLGLCRDDDIKLSIRFISDHKLSQLPECDGF